MGSDLGPGPSSNSPSQPLLINLTNCRRMFSIFKFNSKKLSMSLLLKSCLRVVGSTPVPQPVQSPSAPPLLLSSLLLHPVSNMMLISAKRVSEIFFIYLMECLFCLEMIDDASAQYKLTLVVLLEIETVFGFSANGNLISDSILHTTAEVQAES